LHEVPVQVAVPGNVNSNNSTLDGQMREVPPCKLDDVTEYEDWAVALFGNMRLEHKRVVGRIKYYPLIFSNLAEGLGPVLVETFFLFWF